MDSKYEIEIARACAKEAQERSGLEMLVKGLPGKKRFVGKARRASVELTDAEKKADADAGYCDGDEVLSIDQWT